MKKCISAVFLIIIFFAVSAFPHCQIPCGIYDDDMRFKMIEEDITTVEKSMNEINRITNDQDMDYSQIVRWVDNKEVHADKISDTVTYYFMAQRIKPVYDRGDVGYEDYTNKLVLLHELILYSMKAKQTTDLDYVGKMRDTLEKFKAIY